MTIYIVYQTTCVIDSKFYIGVHRQKPGFGAHDFDGYLGSGKHLRRAITKHGRDSVRRETLFVFGSNHEAFAKESEIVTEEFILKESNYNMSPGGRGGSSFRSEETRKRVSIAKRGIPMSEEFKRKISLANSGERNSFYGKKHSEETKNKMSDVHRLRGKNITWPKVECPHCGKFGNVGPMRAWHFDKCKSRLSPAPINDENHLPTPIGVDQAMGVSPT